MLKSQVIVRCAFQLGHPRHRISVMAAALGGQEEFLDLAFTLQISGATEHFLLRERFCCRERGDADLGAVVAGRVHNPLHLAIDSGV